MVSKQEFENAYREYSPSKIESFYIKNISIVSLFGKIGHSILIIVGLMIPFILSLLCRIFHLPHIIMHISSIIYVNILSITGILYAIVVLKRKKRISNICKKLRINKIQYKHIIHTYYYENYYPADIKDYINNIIDSIGNDELKKNK